MGDPPSLPCGTNPAYRVSYHRRWLRRMKEQYEKNVKKNKTKDTTCDACIDVYRLPIVAPTSVSKGTAILICRTVSESGYSDIRIILAPIKDASRRHVAKAFNDYCRRWETNEGRTEVELLTRDADTPYNSHVGWASSSLTPSRSRSCSPPPLLACVDGS